MASRINVKFVIFLTIGITLVSGMLVGAAYVVLTKSGDEYIARAQAAEAEGDYVRAAEMYGRAVGHDRTNVEWLHMWFDALVQSTPETRPEYEKSYIEHYLGILHSLATLQDRDPAVQRRYLEAVKEHNWWLNPSTEAWEDLADLTSRALDRLDQEAPEAQALRRYRGLAILNQMQLFQPADTVQDQALEDLRAAVAADPEDVESAIAIARWHLIRWQNAQNARRDQEASDYMEGLEEQRARLEERFGQNPEARLFLLEMEIARALATSTTYAQERIAVRGLASLGVEQPLLDVMANLDSPSLSSNFYERLLRVLLVLRPDDGAEIALGIIGRGLENAPNDPELLLLNGSTLGTHVNPEEAIEVLQRLVDLPDMPVGLQGMLLRDFRVQAVAMQCENALRQWERTDPGADKDDWMQRAKAYRSQVVEKSRRGEDDRAVMMLDARIALAELRFQAALAALQRYRTSTSQGDTEVLRLMTRALIGLNQLGAAKSTIEQLLELEPDNVQALLLGAEVDRRLLDNESAYRKLQMAVDIEPDSEELAATLADYEEFLGVRQTDDPVISLLIEVQRLLTSADADVSEVRSRLQQGIADFPDDIRPVLALLEIESSMNNTDEALVLVDRALELDPENEFAKRYRRQLTAEDAIEFMLGEIEIADISEIEKLLRKRAVLLSAERTAEAAAALEQAKAIDDGHPLVIEAEFIMAIDADDLATAQQLQAKAAETNADEVNGALYQVVLDQKRGAHRVAVDSLEAIVQQLPYSGRAWMLLGQSQMQLGRVEQAIDSMRTAFEASPDDLRSAQTLINALMQVQREDEALLIARRSAELNPVALQSQRLRMQLEELAGDLQFAVARRERLYEASPNDMENLLALIRIYVNESRWSDAERLIAHARDISGDSLALAIIEGRAVARQNGVDAGQQIIQEYIASLEPSEINTDPYLAFAEFYLEFEREDEALAAMREATAHQRPDILEADRRIGDFLFDRQRYEEAIEPYTRLADIESDDHAIILKRLAETYSRLQRWDDAEQTVDRMDNGGADDMEAALLRAEIATGRGNAEETEHYLDEAVRLGPGNPLPFIRRAQAHFSDPAFHEDALKDLDQALVLRPTSVRARMMRAALLAESKRHAEAVSELRKGIEYSPENDELRTTLVAELIRLNAWSDATTSAEAAIADRPGEVFWLRFAGDVYMGASSNVASDREVSRNLRRASELYAQAQDLEYDEDYASRLLTSLMLEKPARAEDALRVLNGLEPETQQFSEFLIMRSIIHNELGQPDQALDAANRAFAAATTGGELRVWFAQIPQIFGSPREAAAHMENMKPPAGLETLFDVQLCTVLAGDVGIRSELVERLNRAEAADPDEDTLVDIYRLRSELEYALGDYEASASSLQAGRSLRPDDLEFNNNLAYVLARQLGRLDEAIAPAEKAAELSPNSSTVLDTLGWVYYRTDQIAKAEESLRRAVDLAETAVEAVPANFHMAELMFLREEFRSARRFLERAQQNLGQAPTLQEEFGPELEALMERLDQAE